MIFFLYIRPTIRQNCYFPHFFLFYCLYSILRISNVGVTIISYYYPISFKRKNNLSYHWLLVLTCLETKGNFPFFLKLASKKKWIYNCTALFRPGGFFILIISLIFLGRNFWNIFLVRNSSWTKNIFIHCNNPLGWGNGVVPVAHTTKIQACTVQ